MTERHSRWYEGQLVERRGVTPYTIVKLVGEAGNIHISGTGRWHVFWHREKPRDGRVTIELVHHGGPEGFADLKSVKHQHERVILGYTGLTIQIPLEMTQEVPEEEQKEGTPAPGWTFPLTVEQLQTLEIPGEQAVLNRWIKSLQGANRDLPHVTNHGKLAAIREDLTRVRDGLTKSINYHKQTASGVLTVALAGSRGDLLRGVNDAQSELLERSLQTVRIVVGTMQRYSALESLQIHWNGIVDNLPIRAGSVIRTLQNPSYFPERLERIINSAILDENSGLAGQLRVLCGEPYFSRAQLFVEKLSPVRELWEARDRERMMNLLTSQAKELEVWKRRIHEEYEGVGFGRYNLT